MSRYLVLILAINLFCCKPVTKTAFAKIKAPKVEISTVLEDSISIRALDYTGENYWFAGSQGKYGFINPLTKSISIYTLAVENNLEFRSIATTANYTYILTAGNPALIYKISHEDISDKLIYFEKGESVFYDSLKFWNDNEGIALGDPQDGCFTILKTTDGGKSWHRLSCNDLPAALEGEAAFAASNSNLKVYDRYVWFITGGRHSRVFYSKDRGNTWEVFKTPIISGMQMTGIYAIDFFNENLGFIIGGDWNDEAYNLKNKSISKDGGKTWKLVSKGTGPGYCSDVIFIPQTQGLELMAVGKSGIWWSGDQGSNWRKLSEQSFYTLKMISKNEGYLAGRGKISEFKLIK